MSAAKTDEPIEMSFAMWTRVGQLPESSFTIMSIVYKIFGAMSKDLYSEICVHFGIDSVENLVTSRRNRFINIYGETDNYLCELLC